MTRNALLITVICGLAAASATYFIGKNIATQANETVQSKPATCQVSASKDQAEGLLKRLFPNASFITAEHLALDNMKSVCLLEVEMQVEADKPETRGFVYVLPDGERFLNGPLMDKRSKVGTSSLPSEVKQAFEEQEKRLKQIYALGATPPASAQPATSQAPGIGEATQPGLAGQPVTQQQIPTPAELREKLISKLQTLPSIPTPAEGKPVYVLLDPLCAHCKRLVKSSSDIALKYGVKFHWIPLFLNEGGWALSSHILKTNRESPYTALKTLEHVMSGEMTDQEVAAAMSGLTEADYAAPKDATAVFIELAKHNSRLGTPLVVFRKPDGGIEVISGMPHEQDWATIGSGT
jgi:hypothetical protein